LVLTDYKFRTRRRSVCSALLYNELSSTLSATRCQQSMERFVCNLCDVRDKVTEIGITNCDIYEGEERCIQGFGGET